VPYNLRKALWATLWNIRCTKNSQFPPFDLLHIQPALEIKQSVQIHRRISLDVLVQATSRVKPAVMISRNDNFDLVRLALQPVDLLLDIFGGPGLRQVAGMDENVTGGNIDELFMSIGYADYADGWSSPRRSEGLSSEEEQDVIDVDGDESQWREEELVKESEAFPLVFPAEAEKGEEAHDEAMQRAEMGAIVELVKFPSCCSDILIQ
jgi:hypothetical protein